MTQDTGGPSKRKEFAKAHIHCPRIDRPLSVEEHLDCPYCYGNEKQVTGGNRECFCDFDTKKDPVNFGFPGDTGRYRT